MDGEEYRKSKENVKGRGMEAEQESDIGIKGGGKREPL